MTTPRSASKVSSPDWTRTPFSSCSILVTGVSSRTSSPVDSASTSFRYPPSGTRLPPLPSAYSAAPASEIRSGGPPITIAPTIQSSPNLARSRAGPSSPRSARNHSTPSRYRSLSGSAASASAGSQSAPAAADSAVAIGASIQPSDQTAIREWNAPSFRVRIPAAPSASASGLPNGWWTQAPPRSTDPDPSGTVHVRPPRRSRASSTTTSVPAQRAASAVVSPATPAPTTINLTIRPG